MAKISNLTRVQAQERYALLEVHHYDVKLDLLQGDSTFRSTTTVTFTANLDHGNSTFIDLFADTIHSATLNGQTLNINNFDTEKGIELHGLQAKNELIIDAQMWYSHTGEGLHRYVDPVDNNIYLYTQCEPSDADRVFACFDQPDLKAEFTLHINAPQEWNIITNTSLAAAEGTWRHFETTLRQSTYLVAIIAGPYASFHDTYRDEHGEIPLGIYARQSLAPYVDTENIFRETQQSFGFYQKNFDFPYPYDKYDQIFVPDFNAGAMENIAAVTFTEDYIFRSKVTRYRHERRCETILHEMAHMWFGDLVTMKWFDDLWLNESFATFISVLVQAESTEFTDAWTTFAAVEKAWAYAQDRLSSTHPIVADIPDVHAGETNFDGITYAKGASVLKQLVAYVGLDKFLAGVREYLHTYQYRNATFHDLFPIIEKASGRDLHNWGAQWLHTTGINTISASFSIDNEGKYSEFFIEQGPATPGQGELRTHRIAVGIYDDTGSGAIERVTRHEIDIHQAKTPIPELVGKTAGLIVIPNDDDLTYAHMQLDDKSISHISERLSDLHDSLPAALIWSSLWEATKNAQFKASDFVQLTISHAASITQISVLEKVLLQARTALESYASQVWVTTTGRNIFSQFLYESARKSPAGSDEQLAYFQAFISSALFDPLYIETLQSLLAGTDPSTLGFPGLAIDTDLRWNIVTALARAGFIDAAFIQEEKNKDNTNSGARFAARAQATIPTAAAKHATWDTLFNSHKVSNLLARWACLGFASVGQEQLIAPYHDLFFEHIEQLWEESPSREIPQTVTRFLYPQWSASHNSIEQAERIIKNPDAPSGLRRLVAEGQDETKRILTNRRFDAGEQSPLFG